MAFRTRVLSIFPPKPKFANSRRRLRLSLLRFARANPILAPALLAGCQLFLETPPYDAARLGQIQDLRVRVGVNAAETLMAGNVPRPAWSAQARTNLLSSISEKFSAEHRVIRVIETVPAVPWFTESAWPMIFPAFRIPECPPPVGQAGPTLEVVAFQVVKSTAVRAHSLLEISLVVFAPLAPTEIFGSLYGSGETAIRFCLYEAKTGKVAWAYAEWFHAGLDLRDRTNVNELVESAYESFRDAAKH